MSDGMCCEETCSGVWIQTLPLECILKIIDNLNLADTQSLLRVLGYDGPRGRIHWTKSNAGNKGGLASSCGNNGVCDAYSSTWTSHSSSSLKPEARALSTHDEYWIWNHILMSKFEAMNNRKLVNLKTPRFVSTSKIPGHGLVEEQIAQPTLQFVVDSNSMQVDRPSLMAIQRAVLEFSHAYQYALGAVLVQDEILTDNILSFGLCASSTDLITNQSQTAGTALRRNRLGRRQADAGSASAPSSGSSTLSSDAHSSSSTIVSSISRSSSNLSQDVFRNMFIQAYPEAFTCWQGKYVFSIGSQLVGLDCRDQISCGNRLIDIVSDGSSRVVAIDVSIFRWLTQDKLGGYLDLPTNASFSSEHSFASRASLTVSSAMRPPSTIVEPLVACAYANGNIRLYRCISISRPSASGSPCTSKLIKTFHSNSIATQLSMSPEDRVLAAGFESGDLCFWSYETGKVCHGRGHSGRLVLAKFSPKLHGNALVSVSRDGLVKLWKIKSSEANLQARCLMTLRNSQEVCQAVLTSYDEGSSEQLLFLGCVSGGITVWNIACGEQLAVLGLPPTPGGWLHSTRIAEFAVTKQSNVVALVQDGTIIFWPSKGGWTGFALNGTSIDSSRRRRSMAKTILADDSKVLAAYDDGTIMVWGDPGGIRYATPRVLLEPPTASVSVAQGPAMPAMPVMMSAPPVPPAVRRMLWDETSDSVVLFWADGRIDRCKYSLTDLHAMGGMIGRLTNDGASKFFMTRP